jgi:hypothetical protein
VRSQPIWRVRLVRELPRYGVAAVAAAGIAASLRFAIAPPRPPVVAGEREPVATDHSAEGFAVLFARRYLTWDSSDPARSEQGLESFAGGSVEPGAGVALPERGSQRVDWAEVVASREPERGAHIYTVAAQTDTGGLQYLDVGVTRTAAGALELSGYPAFVGAPASGPAPPAQRREPVEDGALATVVRRALGNYLSGAAAELAADLVPGTSVSYPTVPLQLRSMQTPVWAPGGGAVVATVQATATDGAGYTLVYELDVERVQGRWEVSALETDPAA